MDSGLQELTGCAPQHRQQRRDDLVHVLYASRWYALFSRRGARQELEADRTAGGKGANQAVAVAKVRAGVETFGKARC